ncbi:Aste57867_25133 [Aphanomyces stellatus]|uniref:Aste57867_25133 protein n=1 Tax=Aphanomyces stellatus TaxID=120398 RepID=A0A485LTP9_9STRA|nr:hypothetical protein As57867_025055 [Aphanomyces stellatus]VFU01764.1 Aste57867_25133 [Aphanomyces stellatus]
MRDMSEATGIPLSTLHRHLKEGTIKRRSTRMKPLLTDKKMAERLEFCRSHVRPSGPHGSRIAASGAGEAGLAESAVFDDMWDVVHLDEKCFNADKNVRKVYHTEGEEPEQRAWSSKLFIPKVMFLAAVSRPRHDDERGTNFDGKIGIWPIVEYLPAVCNSRNRPAGTIVPTLVNVDAAVYRDYVITRVIPVIKSMFPTSNERVVLQHDNATPHGGITTVNLACVSTDGWSFGVRCQPPNSPDLNVLYLGFFASIQSLQYKLVSRTLDDVIRATHAAFDLAGSEALAKVFLSLQAVMRLVLENNGGNQFRLPHLRKNALKRAGALMTNVPCPSVLLE